MDEFEMKTFTLDEAQALLPVLEALLKRAIDGKKAAESIEGRLQELSRKIFLSGGLFVDVASVRRQRAALESHVQAAKDSVAEIDSIGVQVKDLDTGFSTSPASSTATSFCSAGGSGKAASISGTASKTAFADASQSTTASRSRRQRSPSLTSRISEWGGVNRPRHP